MCWNEHCFITQCNNPLLFWLAIAHRGQQGLLQITTDVNALNCLILWLFFTSHCTSWYKSRRVTYPSTLSPWALYPLQDFLQVLKLVVIRSPVRDPDHKRPDRQAYPDGASTVLSWTPSPDLYTVFPFWLPMWGSGEVCAIQSRVSQKEKRKKYHPLAQISVGLSLLGVSATCCAQLAKHRAMRNSLGRSRLVYK